jgi:hypothetical protein
MTHSQNLFMRLNIILTSTLRLPYSSVSMKISDQNFERIYLFPHFKIASLPSLGTGLRKGKIVTGYKFRDSLLLLMFCCICDCYSLLKLESFGCGQWRNVKEKAENANQDSLKFAFNKPSVKFRLKSQIRSYRK